MSTNSHHHHRSSMKVPNKPFKGHSKRAEHRIKGKVEHAKIRTVQVNMNESKAERQLRAKQLMQNKKIEDLQRKRIGSRHGPPKIVSLVALTDDVDLDSLAQHLASVCEPCRDVPTNLSYLQTMRTRVENKPARFTFVKCARDPIFVADACKVADVVVFVMAPCATSFNEESEDTFADPLGNHFIQLVKAQGVPTVMGVVQGLPQVFPDEPKKREASFNIAKRWFGSAFTSDIKVHQVDSAKEVEDFLRAAHNLRMKEVHWRDERAHILTEYIEFEHNNPEAGGMEEEETKSGSSATGTLRVTGFLRGNRGLSANQLVHVTGVGDFQVRAIYGHPKDVALDHMTKEEHRQAKKSGMADVKTPEEVYFNNLTLLSAANEDRTPLEGLFPLDPLTGEQSLISDEELLEAARQNPDLVRTSDLFVQNEDGTISLANSRERPHPVGTDPETGLVTWYNQELHLETPGKGGEVSAETKLHVTGEVLFRNSAAAIPGYTLEARRAGSHVTAAMHFADEEENEEQRAIEDRKALERAQGGALSKNIVSLKDLNAASLAKVAKAWDGAEDDEAEEEDDLEGDGDAEDMEAEEKHIGIDGPKGARPIYDGIVDGDDGIRDEGEDSDEEEGKISAGALQKMKNMERRQRRLDPTTVMGQRRAEIIDEQHGETMSTASGMTGMSVRTAGGSTTGIKLPDLPYRMQKERLLPQGLEGEEKLLKLKRKAEQEWKEWPDEVTVFRGEIMRYRFEKYRGLPSFKHSTWDVNLGLPLEYSQIYRFQNFSVSERNAKMDCDIEDDYEDLDEETAGGRLVAPGRMTPVTIEILNFPATAAKSLLEGVTPLLVWALFRYEYKVSVMHVMLRRTDDYDLPVRSKDPMHFQVGFRRFTSRPVFSKVVQGTDKNLMQRFFPKNEFIMASMYARITMMPAPVLMFSAEVFGEYRGEYERFNPLVATGTLHSINPNKLIMKRAVLVGYPQHVHKQRAVVRYMFFNPEDVRWFKPIELWTKEGLHGHILEPRGTHGLFKCVFNGIVQSHDSICMSIYKRQFPVWDLRLL